MDLQDLILMSRAYIGLTDSAAYVISEQYGLRKWTDRAGFLDFRAGTVKPLNALDFLAAQLCNGCININIPHIPESTRVAVRALARQGFVKPCPIGTTLNDGQNLIEYPNRYYSGAKWSVTGRCNLRCKHCFVSAPNAKFGEISHEDCLRLIDAFADCGITRVTLTGGEPLLRDDFLELVDRLTEKKIVLSRIATNGLLVNERLLNALEERGVHPGFNMSYDGVGWHDWLRGMDGAEKQLLKKFELLSKRGYDTGSAMTIHKNNLHTMRASVNTLRDVGCKTVIMNRVTNFGEWSKYGQDCSVTPEELFDAYLEYIPHYFEDGMPVRIVLNRFFTCDRESKNYKLIPYKLCKDPTNDYVCTDVSSNLFISADGQAMPCLAVSTVDELHKNFPSVCKEGLQQCISSEEYLRYADMRYSDYLERNQSCRTCRYTAWCRGGCRAQALDFDPNDYLGKDIPNCVFFHKNYTKKILEAVASVAPDARCVNLPTAVRQELENAEI